MKVEVVDGFPSATIKQVIRIGNPQGAPYDGGRFPDRKIVYEAAYARLVGIWELLPSVYTPTNWSDVRQPVTLNSFGKAAPDHGLELTFTITMPDLKTQKVAMDEYNTEKLSAALARDATSFVETGLREALPAVKLLSAANASSPWRLMNSSLALEDVLSLIHI